MMGKQPKAHFRYCQCSPSCTTQVPIQGIDITPMLQNPQQNMASATQPSSSNSHGDLVQLEQPSIPLPRMGAEVSPILTSIQSNTIPLQQPPRILPEYPSVQGQPTIRPHVASPSTNIQESVDLSVNVPQSEDHENVPTILSSGYSSYILEDNKFGEGTSSGSQRVSCKRRLREDTTSSTWLTLGETSVVTNATRVTNLGSSRNIRPRSEESNREHLLQQHENHLNQFDPLFSQLQGNTLVPPHFDQIPSQVNGVPLANPSQIPMHGVPACYELLPTSNMTNFNNSLGDLFQSQDAGGTSSPTRSFVFSCWSSVPPTFADYFQSQDAGVHFQGLSNSDSMTNPAFQLQQGNREINSFPRIPATLNVNHQNQYSLDQNNVFMPIFSSSNFGAASGESQGPWTHDANVLRSFQAAVSNQMTNGGGGGGSNPNVASSSNAAVPNQQREGRLDIGYHNARRLMRNDTDSSSESESVTLLRLAQRGSDYGPNPENDVGQMQRDNDSGPDSEDIAESDSLNYVPEIASGDEDVNDDEVDEDEYEDLRFDVDDMSYEELLELEEEMGDASFALNVTQIEQLVTRATYTTANADVSTPPESCPICREDYVDGDDIGNLDCEHDYHFECLKKWLQIKNNCPICKKHFSAMV